MSNVLLIDPNEVNINTTALNNVPFVNGIPQYQDMYIFAELTAESRGRTVVMTTGNGENSIGTIQTGLEVDRNVNFMGVNQNNDVNNPNYLKFTTNYYDGSTGTRIQYEGFGIAEIKILVNSSYVPQVNVQFVDIRGLSFFNQENSPYRMLFEFPPPLFHLTVKGYYGKALKYDLHLVKYTSEFIAENGNFVIDAQFVAMTFAPLADIPFRYVINFPLIEEEDSLSSDTSIQPKNTYELILKVKDLYSSIEKEINSGNETKELDNINKSIELIDNQFNVINNYKNDENLKNAGIPHLIHVKYDSDFFHDGNSYPNTGDTYTITKMRSLNEYNTIIQISGSSTIPTNIKDRLYIVYASPNLSNINGINSCLNSYKNSLLTTNVLTLQINQNDIVNPSIFIGNSNIITTTNETTTYIGLDLTNYYVKLYKKKFDFQKDKSDLSKQIGTIVNNSIVGKLGMQPTIYNIFKIILDDVDTFFKILRKTSEIAENKHNEPDSKSKIVDNNPIKNKDKIYAFPLIIDRKSVCGGTKEERIAPIKLSEEIEFPEMDLVKNFINTFQTQARLSELSNMKANQNEDGSNVWIPISPIDSQIDNTNLSSPYINIDSGRINESIDNKLMQFIKISLKRFYILSQGVMPYEFYETSTDINKNNYIKLFAESEALNLVNSLITPDYIDNVKINANKFTNNINNFYEYITSAIDAYNGEQINLFSFPNEKVEYFLIDSTLNTSSIYTNKQNVNFRGVNLNIGNINELTLTEGIDNPINNFIKNNSNFYEKYFFKIPLLDSGEKLVSYTNENLPHIIDIPFKTIRRALNSSSTYDSIEWKTRFLYEFDYSGLESTFDAIFSKIKDYNEVLNQGNKLLSIKGFETLTIDNYILSQGGNIVDLWSNVLSNYDTNIYEKIINVGGSEYNPKLSAFILLSNFGYALSPFNIFPNRLNDFIFNIPAIIELPTFMLAYIGAIVSAIEENWINDVINFFNVVEDNNNENSFNHKGYFVFADIHDIDKFLSENDKKSFKLIYEDFLSDNSIGYPIIVTQLKKLYGEANKIDVDKEDIYSKFLNPNEDNGNVEYYNNIIKPLISRKNIAVYSQITFKPIEDSYTKTYTSINSFEGNDRLVNDKYFSLFFQYILNHISNVDKSKDKEKEQQKKLLADEDIMTQTYYSFKNINDKWLSSPKSNFNGYPFGNNKNLIDSFVFVDRAMNPIGDTMINAEILTSLFDDPNITLYSALSQILSTNGFEFFPLQNFMSYKNDDWKNTFKIDISGINANSPAFVCMYIGGSSSYPTISANGFENDGVENLEQLTDFTTQECSGMNPTLDNQVENYSDFPWRNVRAFRVRFGEQNQSMFTNIKIDSKEYPETNESIQILSRLAGDNKLNAPIPKGQSLYNVYENRAYKATVTAFGNVMIQPTQYFQLENVPMFNGAYLILSVEHVITPNKMMTTFSGTKILKYPIPRVTSPVVFAGLDDLDMNMGVFNNIVSGSAIVEYPNDYLISKWCTYYDGISYNSAKKRNIDNTPTASELETIKTTAKVIYDSICDHFSVKIPITTFFRNEQLNNGVGGTESSWHRLAKAIDLDMDGSGVDHPSNSDVYFYIAQNLPFDQLLWEEGDGNNPGWVHVAYTSVGKNRGRYTIFHNKKYTQDVYTLEDFLTLKKSIYGI
jgi:hypothetical protein